MNVLSLFDGMSCGRIALERAGIKVGVYFASEVDKHAIAVTTANWPQTIQLGDVRNVNPDVLGRIDLLIGGSPCQDFSFAGKRRGMSTKCKEDVTTLERYLELKEEGYEFTGQSYLFWEYVRILHAVRERNPSVKFLLENVKMTKDNLSVLSSALGCEPTFINSSLVSAQNRQRYYWHNWHADQPEDKGQKLMDIIEDGFVDRDKARCLDANQGKGGSLKMYFAKSRRQIVFCGAMRGRYIVDGVRQDAKQKTAGLTKQRIEMRYDGKTNALTTVTKDNHVVFNSDGEKKHYDLPELNFRNLTPVECERLQTVPDNYTAHVSKTQRCRMLGNGWTVDVIAHLFRSIDNQQTDD